MMARHKQHALNLVEVLAFQSPFIRLQQIRVRQAKSPKIKREFRTRVNPSHSEGTKRTSPFIRVVLLNARMHIDAKYWLLMFDVVNPLIDNLVSCPPVTTTLFRHCKCFVTTGFSSEHYDP